MFAQTVEQELNTLKSDLGKLGSDVAKLTKATRKITRKDGRKYLARLRAAVGRKTENVGTAMVALTDKGLEKVDVATHQMRDRPLTSILVVLGLGIAIGKLVDR